MLLMAMIQSALQQPRSFAVQCNYCCCPITVQMQALFDPVPPVKHMYTLYSLCTLSQLTAYVGQKYISIKIQFGHELSALRHVRVSAKGE